MKQYFLNRLEIADYQHFLPFPQGLRKASFRGSLTLSSIYTHFNTLKKKALLKHCGKRWNAQNEQFHLFPQCFLCNLSLNPLPNDNILGLPKLKAFADNKIKVTENLKFVLWRIENIVGKGENAGYQHFLLFPQCLLKASFSGASKVGIVW